MPVTHPSHVVSFSSEDPHHPASNLLNRETFRKWKCKDAGEKEAFVILKFDKAVTINCIDIGNDGSALVEVSVARSGNGLESQYEVLLSSTAFISPLDSREGKNLNGVKSFSINSLCKPIATQKWDLVKIQVSQPFNRHVQYGLTFIKFVTAPDPNEPPKIGIFGIRKPIGGGESDSDDDLRPGSLFSSKLCSPKLSTPAAVKSSNLGKLNSSSPRNISTAAAIRETSAQLTNASKSASEDSVKNLLHSRPKLDLPSLSSIPKNDSPVSRKKQTPDTSHKATKGKNDSSDNKSSASMPAQVTNGASSKKRTLSPDREASTSNIQTPTKKSKKIRKTKPFHQLFDGVVFSMSGFENPLRGQLRDKAIEMGARYKADWDRTCTHLICAFFNTPKFRQVKGSGNGKIVKKSWIEKSHMDRCRYPWRRYCLDRQDQGSESEEEVHQEQENGEELLDDTLESPETKVDVKKKRALVIESSDENEGSDDSRTAYEVETDVDEEKVPVSLFNQKADFFKNHYFCIYLPLDLPDKSLVETIISKYKGQIHESPDDNTEYCVCHNLEWKDEYTDALSDNPNLVFVHKDWIFECDKDDCFVKIDSFMLSPN